MRRIHSIKVEEDLPIAVHKWIKAVLQKKVNDRHRTFSTLISHPEAFQQLRFGLLEVVKELLVQNFKIEKRCRTFFLDTFSKIDFIQNKTNQKEWPVIFKIRWERKENNIYWAFFMNASSQGIVFKELTKEIMVQDDEIDDELEVFSLPYHELKTCTKVR